VTSKGYSFFFESLHILHFNKLVIKEIPNHSPAAGPMVHSKMGPERDLAQPEVARIHFFSPIS